VITWRHDARLSLRWRLLLIGITGLSVGLALGGWLLLTALQLTFERSVDTGADRTAVDVAGLIAADRLPQPVPVAGAQLVQVVDRQNRVRAGSPGVDRLVPLLSRAELDRALSGERLHIDGARAGLDGQIRVLAVTAGRADDQLAVTVAVPLADVQQAWRTLRLALLAVFAPLVAGLAAVAWWAIGRTLRPVETLRLGAEEITGRSGAEAGRRLPVPAGADEIHRLAVTLNGMLDRLGDARERQRRFVADAAHELRNPLAGIRTQLEVARRHPAGTDWEELSEDLLLDTDRLTRLTNDLLLLARIDEAGEAEVTNPGSRTSRTVAVQPVLDQVAARYREARLPVRPRTQSAELLVTVDPEDLHRVLTNLVDNAVRHARSAVWLAAEARGEHTLITVTDDGPGIPEADRDRVFDRFTRLDDARAADDGGAGLGLAIVAELVRRADGVVRLSAATPGLRVEVLLPAAAANAATAAAHPRR
jgi:signal transduction histidine kinase